MPTHWHFFAVAFIVLIAGCHGGNGGGNPDPTVEITNANSLEERTGHKKEVSVRAEARDGTAKGMTRRFTVFNRTGGEVTTGSREMEKIDDFWSAEIPGQKSGYRVSYEVHATFGDGTKDTAKSDYRINYINNINGPDKSTRNVSSRITVDLYTANGVDAITVEFNRLQNGEQVSSGTVRIKDPNSSTVTAEIKNDKLGSGLSDRTIEYTVSVLYGPGDDPIRETSETKSYVYDDHGADILYVPITFNRNANETAIDVLDTRSRKANEFYRQESGGKVDLTREWIYNSSALVNHHTAVDFTV